MPLEAVANEPFKFSLAIDLRPESAIWSEIESDLEYHVDESVQCDILVFEQCPQADSQHLGTESAPSNSKKSVQRQHQPGHRRIASTSSFIQAKQMLSSASRSRRVRWWILRKLFPGVWRNLLKRRQALHSQMG